MTIWDHIRQTEARIEAAEFEQAVQAERKAAEKKLKPKLKALEKVARGLTRAQELQERHELKQRLGKLHRRVHGWNEYEQDDAKRALAEAAEVAQRNHARNEAEVQALATADRQTRWTAERTRIMRERFRLKREAEENGNGYLEMPPLPVTVPDWFEAEPDGVRVRVHKPSVPMPRYSDGTVTLAFDEDVISGGHPGPELKTAEQQFAEAEGR